VEAAGIPLTFCHGDLQAAMQNPYAPTSSDLVVRTEAYLPSCLATRTNWLVTWVGLFEFFAWIIVAFWTDQLFLDIIALFIATNGARVGPNSCRTFPWTAVMCVVYPFAFCINLGRFNALDFANWLPLRHSPVLGLQLIVALWGGLAAGALLRCYLHQNSSQGLAKQSDSPEPPISREFES
jgi:hypothetical protein